MTRALFVVLAIAALGGSAWVLSLPSKAECRASGRTVDPTERHCESADGWVQLEEHAAFHGSQIALGVAVLLAGGWVVRRVVRSRLSPREGT